mgnify:CR=1 FL=1
MNLSVYNEKTIYIEDPYVPEDEESVSTPDYVDDVLFIDVGETHRLIGWDESIEAFCIERFSCGVILDVTWDGYVTGISEGTAIIEASVSTSCGKISYRWKVVVSDPEADFGTDE